jgi:hypothetical protein
MDPSSTGGWVIPKPYREVSREKSTEIMWFWVPKETATRINWSRSVATKSSLCCAPPYLDLLEVSPPKKTYTHYRFPTWWIFHLVNKQNHLKQSQVMTWLTKQAFWVYRQGEDHPLFGIVWRWGIPWYTLKASQSCNFHSECGYWPINLFRDTICSQKTFMFYAFLTYPQPRSLLNSFETLSDSLSPLWPAVLGHFGLWASEMFVVPQTSILIHIIGHLKWGWTPTWSYGSYSTASFQITPACPGPRPFPE